MKIELNEEAVWLGLYITIAVFLISLAVTLSYYSTGKFKAAVAAGLEEIPDSSQSTHWGKKQ